MMVKGLFRHLDVVIPLGKDVDLIASLLQVVFLSRLLVFHHWCVVPPSLIDYLHHVANSNLPVFCHLFNEQLILRKSDKVSIFILIRLLKGKQWNWLAEGAPFLQLWRWIKNGFELFYSLRILKLSLEFLVTLVEGTLL